jgi:SAM-dependent methyltransferase
MNPAEYAQMARVADEHWWYRGLRDGIVRAVRRCGLPTAPPAAIVDAGCGTGENLQRLDRDLSPVYAGGFDLSPIALEHARRKCPRADVYLSDICQPELHVTPLDLVLSCDVISVPGMTAAMPGLKRLADALRPGGLFVLNVPAYQWLLSHHDAAVHQVQRFCAREIRRLMSDLGLAVELLTYRMWALFPIIVLKRLPSLLRRRRDVAAERSDTVLPSRWLNSLLTGVLHVENLAIDGGLRFPWGSSVFAVGRKR